MAFVVQYACSNDLPVGMCAQVVILHMSSVRVYPILDMFHITPQ